MGAILDYQVAGAQYIQTFKSKDETVTFGNESFREAMDPWLRVLGAWSPRMEPF